MDCLEVWHHMSSYHKTMQEVYFEFHNNGMWNHPSVQDWKKHQRWLHHWKPLCRKMAFHYQRSKGTVHQAAVFLMAPLGGLHVAASTKRQPTNGDRDFFFLTEPGGRCRVGPSGCDISFHHKVWWEKFPQKSFPQKNGKIHNLTLTKKPPEGCISGQALGWLKESHSWTSWRKK